MPGRLTCIDHITGLGLADGFSQLAPAETRGKEESEVVIPLAASPCLAEALAPSRQEPSPHIPLSDSRLGWVEQPLVTSPRSCTLLSGFLPLSHLCKCLSVKVSVKYSI